MEKRQKTTGQESGRRGIGGVFGFAGKVLLIAAAVFIAILVVGGLTTPAETAQAAPEDGAGVMLPLLLVAVADGLVLALIVTQSRWRGLALIVGLTLSFYGAQTVLGQIEALAFLTPLGEVLGAGSVPALEMPVEQIVSSFIVGAARAILAVPLAVVLFGKAKRGSREGDIDMSQGMALGQWVLKLGVIVVLYELLYFGFGYYVAWRNPAVQAFYQGTDPGSFLAQMRHVVTETPSVLLLQVFRALLWAVVALPVVDMLEEKPWVGALATGLLLAIPANIQHIIPNPYMPPDVRMAHFVETASSTFIFGAAVFWLLHRAHRSFADLFGASA